MIQARLFFALTPLLVLIGTAASAQAQISKFGYKPDKITTGVVYHYLKSNIDGTNSGEVSLYVKDKDTLESLKWHKGDSRATLVIADIDWENRFSVKHFETWLLTADGEPQQRAVLDFDADIPGVTAKVGEMEFRAEVKNWYWHSYDFDFASLNFAWRHLVNPEDQLVIGIVDVVRKEDGPTLAEKGSVQIDYQQDTTRNGHECREYKIDGPGLENKGGTIWVRKSDGVFVDYEIELPDEPGYESGKMLLKSEEQMTNEEWEEFKRKCVGQ